MDWRRSRLFTLTVVFLAHFLLSSVGYSQAPENQKWSKESWENAKDGIDYGVKEEKMEQKRQDFDIDFEVNEWYNSNIGKVLIILLLVGLFIFILVRVLSANHDAKVKKEEDELFNLQYVEENLDKADIDKFLNTAIDSQDYRVAIRLFYLKAIKTLHQQEIIAWRKDKTNSEFLNEMRQHSSYKIFRDLTLAYEIAWYGDHEISLREFEHIKTGFGKFYNLLNLPQS